MRPARTRPAALLALVCLALSACSGSAEDLPRSTEATTSSATASSTPSEVTVPQPDHPVEAALAGMDRRAQVAQLFVVGVELTDLSPGDELVADGVDGVFLAGRSQAPVEDIAASTSRWTDAAPGPAPLGRRRPGGRPGPGAAGLRLRPAPGRGRAGAAAARPAGRLAGTLGAHLASAGVTLDLAPVADVVPTGTEEANDPIGAFGRQYGSTAADVVPDVRALSTGWPPTASPRRSSTPPGLGWSTPTPTRSPASPTRSPPPPASR